jgi:hypothetical protein
MAWLCCTLTVLYLAGGIGTFVNADYLGSVLVNTDVKAVPVAVSG